MTRLEFDKELTSSKEVKEMLDFLTDLNNREQTRTEGDGAELADPNKTQAVLCTYKILKYLTKGTKAKVTYELNKPYKSMGCVSIVGKEIMFDNQEWFVTAVKLASNFDVYPKTDGTVQMDFTFHGLTIPSE